MSSALFTAMSSTMSNLPHQLQSRISYWRYYWEFCAGTPSGTSPGTTVFTTTFNVKQVNTSMKNINLNKGPLYEEVETENNVELTQNISYQTVKNIKQ